MSGEVSGASAQLMTSAGDLALSFMPIAARSSSSVTGLPSTSACSNVSTMRPSTA